MSRSRTNSGANTPRAGSSPEIIDAGEGDLGDVDMPPHSPPGYDDVSLDDITPIPSIAGSSTSRANSPHNEPPPDYSSGPTQTRNHRLSAHMADLAAQATDSEDAAGQDVIPEQRQRQRSSRGLDGVPQLPSLRLTRLPQIVIEPSSAQPRDQEPSLMPSPDPSTR
ncbi:hypothetical protein VTK73DRAFT_2584 [Phialemonium thermophilum]|uniref:Uncharacterized protein n=1 Tax=Phialemonium thermophilum TaxID=223376 RepID=A0ABR3X3Z9_9PEZI